MLQLMWNVLIKEKWFKSYNWFALKKINEGTESLMNSISQNVRYLPHDLNKKFYAVCTYKMATLLIMSVVNIILVKLLYLVGIESLMEQKNL